MNTDLEIDGIILELRLDVRMEPVSIHDERPMEYWD